MTSSEPAEPPVRVAAADAEQRIRQEIEQTREQLGDTVEALAGKLDVPARARSWMAARTGAMADRAGTVRGQLAATSTRDRQQAAAAAAISMIVVYLVIRSWGQR
jgi:hypothetical protein